MNTEQNFQKRYDNLNKEQKDAVDCIDGPIMVIAGPGSGKTELLSLRVANILKQTDVLASSILCLTFTDSAAKNMRDRLAGLIGAEAYKVAIHTFHSFGTEIINQNAEYFYKGAKFKPADDIIQIEILEEILKDLDHKSQLNSYSPTQGYNFIKEIKSKISDLKKGGITPQGFKEILEINNEYLENINPLIIEAFSERTSKSIFPKIHKLIVELREIPIKQINPKLNLPDIKSEIISSLELAINEAEDLGKTTPITVWKTENTKANIKKQTCIKDFLSKKKHLELADVYEKYQNNLNKKGYFDYSDMILDTIQGLESNPDLKFNIQEKYQYILVDEFQDTSGAQMRLLDNLLDAEVNEGRPNILTVGDDDQSIYKFQGANIGNILNFPKKFKEPKIIVLQKNYRSNQNILNLIRSVIVKGEERLETMLPEQIKKELVASNPDIKSGELILNEFTTQIEEISYIAEQILSKIESGEQASEIAVIMRKHADLEIAAKILMKHKIPVNYEKKKNALDEIIVQELLTIIKYVNSIIQKGEAIADELLPTILSYKFLEIPRIDIWKISITSRSERKSWLEIMQSYENPKVQEIAKFLIHLGVESKEKPAEEIIDFITGARELEFDNGEMYKSNFKNFYFSAEKYEENSNAYIEYLSALKTIINAVRNHNNLTNLTVKDLVQFIELLETHKIHLDIVNVYKKNDKEVNLITSHSAKGQEFKTVYLAGAQDSTWLKGKPALIKFPINLPLSAQKDNDDDTRRLVYVSMSRAKEDLIMSYHKHAETGRAKSLLRFLVEELEIQTPEQSKDIQTLLEESLENEKIELMQGSEKNLIEKKVENYQLNVTHLNTFLNVIDGGPKNFFETNLLNFPQKQSKNASYGSAVHSTLEQLLIEIKKGKKDIKIPEILQNFEINLLSQRLNKTDFEKELKRGHDELIKYLESKLSEFEVSDFCEFDFKGQGVKVGDIDLTGKIDRMKIDKENNEILVIDYKTGKPLSRWEGLDEFEKQKKWKLRNQIIFYKILVENSREFSQKYTVNKGVLEFIRANSDEDIISLDCYIKNEELDRMVKLIEAVGKKIKNLDFPDTSIYEKTIKGIEQFENDLIDNNI